MVGKSHLDLRYIHGDSGQKVCVLVVLRKVGTLPRTCRSQNTWAGCLAMRAWIVSLNACQPLLVKVEDCGGCDAKKAGEWVYVPGGWGKSVTSVEAMLSSMLLPLSN